MKGLNPNLLKQQMRLIVIAFVISQSPACLAASPNYLQQGITAYNNGNFAIASADLKAAVTMAPSDARAHYYLANVYLQLKAPPALAYGEYWQCYRLTAPGQLHQYSVDALAKLEGTYPELIVPTEMANPVGMMLERIRNRSDQSYTSHYDDPLRLQAEAYFKHNQDLRVQKAAATDPALMKTVGRIQTQSDIVRHNIGDAGKAMGNDYSSGLQLEIENIEKERDRKMADMTAIGTHYRKRDVDAVALSFSNRIADLHARIEQESQTQRTDASVALRHFDRDVEDLTDQLTNKKSLPGTPVLQSTGTNLYTRQYADPGSLPKKYEPPPELKATPEALVLDEHKVPGKSIHKVTREPDTKLDVKGSVLSR